MTDEAPTGGLALVTGGALRIGAEICRTLHRAGFSIALHYRSSDTAARELAREFNESRADSCHLYRADLAQEADIAALCRSILDEHAGLDLLVNNASLYYRTGDDADEAHDWEQLIASNLRAPYQLIRQLQCALESRGGSVVNILDAHSGSAVPGYAVYDMTKNGLASLTRSLARELAPGVRVNGVAPGMILWPETRDKDLSDAEKQALLGDIPMARLGEPTDIAEAVLYLARAAYVTGHTLVVDGGRYLR